MTKFSTTKNVKNCTTPYVNCYTTLWNVNIRQWHKLCRIYIEVKFKTCSISYWHCHRICSKYPRLTGIQACKCVCHSLMAGRVFIYLFPPPKHTGHNLRLRSHKFTLHTPVTKQNYLHRMLFLDMYWVLLITLTLYYISPICSKYPRLTGIQALILRFIEFTSYNDYTIVLYSIFLIKSFISFRCLYVIVCVCAFEWMVYCM